MTQLARTTPSSASGTADIIPASGGVAIEFAGDWRMSSRTLPVEDILLRLEDIGRPGRVVLRADHVKAWDTSFLLILRRIAVATAGRNGTLEIAELPEGMRRLLDLSAKSEGKAEARKGPKESSWLGRVGLWGLASWHEFSVFIGFVGEAAMAFLRMLRGKARFRGSDLAMIMQDVGASALPIVSLISVLVGVILAFVGAVQLRQFGVEIYVANLVGIAMLREMGALMTAIIMAGRTGAAFAAEIGSMQSNEEVDALSTLGFNPIDFLVLPRVIALVVMMPLLCLYADVLGILGGALIGTTLLGLDFSQYWAQTLRALNMTHLFIGLAKASVFGVIVALAGCQRGIAAGRSAAAVGLATTSSVVLAIVLIVVADGLFAVALDILGL